MPRVALDVRDPETRKRRGRVERLFGGSKDRRRVATRYDCGVATVIFRSWVLRLGRLHATI